MNEKILRYAKSCVEHVHRNGSYPGGVSKQDWPGVLKDCRKYIELADRTYKIPEQSQQRDIDNYRIECLEYRLKKYVASARNWGRTK